jgi:PAS domain S-box-containing protein
MRTEKQRSTEQYNFANRITILFIVIAVSFFINFAVFSSVQRSQAADALIVDGAGRNRMLSQRIALFAGQVINGETQVRSNLQAAIDLFDVSVHALAVGGSLPGITDEREIPPASPEVLPAIEFADQLWRQYQQAAEVIADGAPEIARGDGASVEVKEAHQFILANAAELLERSNSVVKAFVAENLQKQKRLRAASIALVIFDILLLVLSYVLTRRFIGQFERKQAQNAKLNKDLRREARNLKASNADTEQQLKDLETSQKSMGQQAMMLENQRTAMLNLLEDIESESKVSEEARAKFEGAFDSAPIGIALVSLEGNWLEVNDALPGILGYSKKELLKMNFQQITHAEDLDADLEYVQQMLNGDIHHYQMEKRYIHKEGYPIWALLSVAAVRNDEGQIQYFISQIIDISAQKEIDQAKTEFVSLASHQLRTPLSAINWFTEMLLNEDPGPINEQQRKYLEEVAFGSQRMVDLVNALLNVSRLELGTFAVEPEPTDLGELLKGVVQEMKPMTLKKKQRVLKKIDKTLTNISVDPKLMRIVFQNLVSNAAKYTPEKGAINIELTPITKGKTKHGVKIKQDSILFCVKDNGLGIPASQHDKIFTKLFRADNVRSSDTEGTGLGLYIIKSIVDHVDGQIWFKSEEGKGTTFCVTIPKAGMKVKKGSKQLSGTK